MLLLLWFLCRTGGHPRGSSDFQSFRFLCEAASCEKPIEARALPQSFAFLFRGGLGRPCRLRRIFWRKDRCSQCLHGSRNNWMRTIQVCQHFARIAHSRENQWPVEWIDSQSIYTNLLGKTQWSVGACCFRNCGMLTCDSLAPLFWSKVMDVDARAVETTLATRSGLQGMNNGWIIRVVSLRLSSHWLPPLWLLHNLLSQCISKGFHETKTAGLTFRLWNLLMAQNFSNKIQCRQTYSRSNRTKRKKRSCLLEVYCQGWSCFHLDCIRCCSVGNVRFLSFVKVGKQSNGYVEYRSISINIDRISINIGRICRMMKTNWSKWPELLQEVFGGCLGDTGTIPER